MACRDTKTAEKVAKEISRQTGGELVVMKLDLASLTSVRAFAEELKSRESRIHILINNAGMRLFWYLIFEILIAIFGIVYFLFLKVFDTCITKSFSSLFCVYEWYYVLVRDFFVNIFIFVLCNSDKFSWDFIGS